MKHNYIFIPYNFERFDFERLRKEQRAGGGKILWKYGNKCPEICKDDICYIYCSHLPDMISRILIRAEVSDINLEDNGEPCFELRDIRPIRLPQPDNSEVDITYSYEKLKKYGITMVRRKFKFDPETNPGHFELIECLEHEPKKGKLNDIRLYYDRITKCVFEGHDHNPNIHKTFITRKGLFFRETHHVIPKEVQKELNISDKDIENICNKEYLCPLCHSKIHYGKENEVRKMIVYLYSRRRDFYDDCYAKYASPSDGGTINWLFKLYNVGR